MAQAKTCARSIPNTPSRCFDDDLSDDLNSPTESFPSSPSSPVTCPPVTFKAKKMSSLLADPDVSISGRRFDGTVAAGMTRGEYTLYDIDALEKFEIAAEQLGHERQARERENRAIREFRRWCYAEEYADKQREREHAQEMQAGKLAHERYVVEREVRKLELEVELQRLRNQGMRMARTPEEGEGRGEEH